MGGWVGGLGGKKGKSLKGESYISQLLDQLCFISQGVGRLRINMPRNERRRNENAKIDEWKCKINKIRNVRVSRKLEVLLNIKLGEKKV